MENYRVEVSATAEKQIRGLGQQDQLRILRAIRRLATDPRPRGARKLRGYDDVFRVRVGTFRIVYSIESDRLLVIVLKVGHRSGIYR